MDYWNIVFWLLFVIVGGFVITGSFIRVIFIDILFGLFLVIIGVLKLCEDITRRNIDRKHENMNKNMDYLTNRVGMNTTLTKILKEKHNHRFMHMDRKRAEIENAIENNYRELAKKIMHVENKLNEVGNALAREIREIEKTGKNRFEKTEKKIKMLKESQKSNTRELKEKIREIKTQHTKKLKNIAHKK